MMFDSGRRIQPGAAGQLQRIVVTGSRNLEDYAFVAKVLDDLHARKQICRLAHGACTGADELAKRWATEHGVLEVGYSANWAKYGNIAGPRRNLEMLRKEDPDLVVAFPGGRGTRDLIKKAEEMSIAVMIQTFANALPRYSLR